MCKFIPKISIWMKISTENRELRTQLGHSLKLDIGESIWMELYPRVNELQTGKTTSHLIAWKSLNLRGKWKITVCLVRLCKRKYSHTNTISNSFMSQKKMNEFFFFALPKCVFLRSSVTSIDAFLERGKYFPRRQRSFFLLRKHSFLFSAIGIEV